MVKLKVNLSNFKNFEKVSKMSRGRYNRFVAFSNFTIFIAFCSFIISLYAKSIVATFIGFICLLICLVAQSFYDSEDEELCQGVVKFLSILDENGLFITLMKISLQQIIPS